MKELMKDERCSTLRISLNGSIQTTLKLLLQKLQYSIEDKHDSVSVPTINLQTKNRLNSGVHWNHLNLLLIFSASGRLSGMGCNSALINSCTSLLTCSLLALVSLLLHCIFGNSTLPNS